MLLLTLSRSDSREIKPSYAATFCGDAFIEAWGKVCEYKRLQHGRKRRSIEGKRFHALSSIAKKSINIIKFLVSKLENIEFRFSPQWVFTCSKSTLETPEQYVKSVQS